LSVQCTRHWGFCRDKCCYWFTSSPKLRW